MDNAVAICAAVMEALGSTKENPVILNLPNTVEMCTANTYADQVEYFIRHLPNREAAVISIHPHNDRGTGVAASELALLAGAERVEGTLFGNGERTGNLDIVTMGLNMYTQGVDPGLDFSRLPALKEMYERCTKMRVPERQPYAGELVFTAFSGSHQDAINKGMQYMRDSGTEYWEIPYLPIDPADVGRQYEPIIRINSQSGEGRCGLCHADGFRLQPAQGYASRIRGAGQGGMRPAGRELSSDELFGVFRRHYLEVLRTYALAGHTLFEESGSTNGVHFKGTLSVDGVCRDLEGTGNGPLDAFFNALRSVGITGYTFQSYHEHAISTGSDSKAIAYIELKTSDGKPVFGVGIESNINLASIQGVLCAMNRASAEAGETAERLMVYIQDKGDGYYEHLQTHPAERGTASARRSCGRRLRYWMPRQPGMGLPCPIPMP